jgi:LacI family transcriptional regulator
MATIRQIAALANVSPGAVSRALNNDKSLSISEETRKRIFDIAKKLKYKTYKDRGSMFPVDIQNAKIGLVLCHSIEEEFNDPYYLSIRQEMEMRFNEMGLEMPKVVRLNPNMQDSLDDLDGIIVVGKVDIKDIRHIFKKNDNIVFVDSISPDIHLYDSVYSDFGNATVEMLDHLFSLGYKNIGYIGGWGNRFKLGAGYVQEYSEIRYKTYENIMRKIGLFNQENIYLGEWSATSGYELMKNAIAKGTLPEAFFIASDPMAFGALKALHESGIKIPQEVAITGFDGIDMSAFAQPPLTTVKIHTDQMGKTAVNLLLDRIIGRKIALQAIVPIDLIIRESSGGA